METEDRAQHGKQQQAVHFHQDKCTAMSDHHAVKESEALSIIGMLCIRRTCKLFDQCSKDGAAWTWSLNDIHGNGKPNLPPMDGNQRRRLSGLAELKLEASMGGVRPKPELHLLPVLELEIDHKLLSHLSQYYSSTLTNLELRWPDQNQYAQQSDERYNLLLAEFRGDRLSLLISQLPRLQRLRILSHKVTVSQVRTIPASPCWSWRAATQQSRSCQSYKLSNQSPRSSS